MSSIKNISVAVALSAVAISFAQAATPGVERKAQPPIKFKPYSLSSQDGWLVDATGNWQGSGAIAPPHQSVSADFASMSGGNFNGRHMNLGSGVGDLRLFNSSGNAMIVTANGGRNRNRFDLSGHVDGIGLVAHSTTANDSWNKLTSITFVVPAKTWFNVQSFTYKYGPGSFSVIGFVVD